MEAGTGMKNNKKTWLLPKPKTLPKPKVHDNLRAEIDSQVAPVVAILKKRHCKRSKFKTLNWPDDLFTRWHRNALYFVVVMRTPHGRPETFETHAAKMEYAGDGKFNLAMPMRKGWNTFLREASLEECLEEIGRSVCL